MKRGMFVVLAVIAVPLAYACSSDEAAAPGGDAGSSDAPSVPNTDGAKPDDASKPDDSGPTDANADADAALPPNTVVQISPGVDHTCALLASGAVWCWGANYAGMLGLGVIDNLKHAAAQVPGLAGVVALASGNHHTCALDKTGGVRCWGSNQIMQLGHDPVLDAGDGGDILCGSNSCNPVPRQVTGLEASKAIGSLVFTSCARLTTGAVKCWGYNGYTGFLGHEGPDLACFYGNECNFNASVVANVPEGALTIGSAFGCVVDAGNVSCWGNNYASQLAVAADMDAHVAPVAVSGLPAISAVFAGNASPYAIGPNGQLFGWGENVEGQVTGSCDAAVVAPVSVLPSGVTAAGGGATYGCALASNGTVSCWGGSGYGQPGPSVEAGTKCVPPTTVTGLTKVTLLATAFAHICVRKDDNTVWCWGYNNDGQLGHDPATDPACPSGKCSPTPTKVLGLP